MKKAIIGWTIGPAIVVLGIWVWHFLHFSNADALFSVGDLLQVLATLALPFLLYLVIERRREHMQYYLDAMDRIRERRQQHHDQVASFFKDRTDENWQEVVKDHAAFIEYAGLEYGVLYDLALRQEQDSVAAYLNMLRGVVDAHSKHIKTDEYNKPYIRFADPNLRVKDKEQWQTLQSDYITETKDFLRKLTFNHHIAVCALKGIKTPEP